MSSSIRPARGRTAPGPARPLNASSAAGSRAKPALSSSKSSTSAAHRSLAQSNAARPNAPDATTVKSSQSRTHVEPATRVRATTTMKGTHLGAGKSTTSSALPSSAPKVHTRPQGPDAPSGPETSDALQLAAQSCAWAYMTSSLEEELKRSNNAAQTALKTRKQELATEEADIADSRTRYEAERMLDFYDDLSDRKVAEEIAGMVRRFTSLEKVVGEVTTTSLRLTSLPLDDTTEVQQYNDVLAMLDELEGECQILEAEVLSLSGTISSQDGRLPSVLDSVLNIVRGHAENVESAQRLVRCFKESYRMGIGTLTLV